MALVLLFAVTSCKKENDFGGQAKIEGTVTMKGAPLYGAFVYLAFDADDKATTFNASAVTDDAGKYTFGGLLRGKYYVTAEYTDDMGIKYTSGGALITIGDKKGTVQADLTLE